MKKENSPEKTKEQIIKKLNESQIKIVQAGMNSLLQSIARSVKEKSESESDEIIKQAVIKTINQLMPVPALIAALKNFGLPKSLIFITASGVAIDLLQTKELKENDLFNQVLDNVPVNKPKTLSK